MRRAVLISRDVTEGLRLATRLSTAGQSVSAVLLDSAVAVARAGHADGPALQAALEAGVAVSAHDEAMSCRAITEPVQGVRSVDLDDVADLLLDGPHRVVWT